jgi:hypothetical protein
VTDQKQIDGSKSSNIRRNPSVFVCQLYGRSSGGAGRSCGCKPLISLGGARRRSSWRSKGGAAELPAQEFEKTQLLRAELERRSGGARPYKRGGLLRCLPASPLSFEDSKKSSASVVCLIEGRRLGIRFGGRRSMPVRACRSTVSRLPHRRVSVRVP